MTEQENHNAVREAPAKEKRAKRIGSILLNILVYLFFALCILLLIFSISAKRDSDGAVNLFGRRLYVVQSGSMERSELTYESIKNYPIKDIPTGSMVFVELVPEEGSVEWYASLKTGDVLTFRYCYALRQETVTHRIVSIEKNESGSGYTIRLQGDNRAEGVNTLIQVIDTAEENSPNYVVGKVTGLSLFLGRLVSFLRTVTGVVTLVILPCALIIAWQAFRIVFAVREGRRDEERKKAELQKTEIETLRQRVSELEQELNEKEKGA